MQADGLEGRGRFPGPLQAIDAARYLAYLRTQAALEAEEEAALAAASALSVAAATGGAGAATAPVGKQHTAYTPSQLAAMWKEAAAAYAHLTSTFDADDLAFHRGFAYCTSRAAALELGAMLDSSSSAASEGEAIKAVTAASAPLPTGSSDNSTIITGVAGLDAILSSGLSKLLSSSSSSSADASGSSSSSKHASRGVSLALLELVASRLELAHRLQTSLPSSGFAQLRSHVEGTVIPTLQTQLVSLLQSYVRLFGSKPCCFTDVMGLLVMALPATSTSPSSPPADASNNSASTRLLAFLSPDARILSTHYHPLQPVGDASDASTAQPLFRWSTPLPSAAVEPLVAQLRQMQRDNRPTEETAAEITKLCGDARAAAVAAAGDASGSAPDSASPPPLEGVAPADSTAVQLSSSSSSGGKGGKKKDKKKGKDADKKKKKTGKTAALTLDSDSEDEEEDGSNLMTPAVKGGGKSGGTKDFDPSDPHGVASALKGAGGPLLMSDAAEARLNAIRAGIRRYSTALQCLRYLGSLPTSSGDEVQHDEASIINELVGAWHASLPLLTLQPEGLGNNREPGEGDDLLLMAAHMLWARGVRALLSTSPPSSSSGADAAPASAISSSSLLAARTAFVESLMLLQTGLAASPHNAQLRLAAIRAYGWCGAHVSVFQAWRELRIK